MADLVARETMKELDRLLTDSRPAMRRSMAEMVNRPYRFQFTYFVREYFEDFKNKFVHIQATAGMDQREYDAWLQKMGPSDSWSSRLQYVTYLEANERSQKLEKETTS